MVVTTLVFGVACSTLGDWDYCKYDRSRTMKADGEASVGTPEAHAAQHLGTFLARPVWVPVDGKVPAPGVLEELVFDVKLTGGRVHELHSKLESGSEPWCPAERLDASVAIQVRSPDGGFWVAETDVDRSAYVLGYGLAGMGGPVGGRLPVQRYPEEWAELVPPEADWELEGFSLTTVAPSRFNGMVEEARSSNMEIDISADRRHSERGTHSSMTLFGGYVWDLEPI